MSFTSNIVKPAITLGTTNTFISGALIASCIALHNTHTDVVTVATKDGNGRTIDSRDVAAGQTEWIDMAQVTKGKGFLFENGLVFTASVANKVHAWVCGYEESNSEAPFSKYLYNPAITLPDTKLIVTRQDTMLSALALYNSHSADVTVTPQDANDRILAPQTIEAGRTAWVDLANRSNNLGFLFSGGLRLTASSAGKIHAWINAWTQ